MVFGHVDFFDPKPHGSRPSFELDQIDCSTKI